MKGLMEELVKVTGVYEKAEVAKQNGDECPNHKAEVVAWQGYIQWVEGKLERAQTELAVALQKLNQAQEAGGENEPEVEGAENKYPQNSQKESYSHKPVPMEGGHPKLQSHSKCWKQESLRNLTLGTVLTQRAAERRVNSSFQYDNS